MNAKVAKGRVILSLFEAIENPFVCSQELCNVFNSKWRVGSVTFC